MMIKEKITVRAGVYDDAFNNNVDFCVGTGRMGLALHREYFEQLKYVQEEIGFKHIRGHGLFCDDVGIYHEYEDENGETRVEYNYTYLDRIFDGYLSLNIRPFLELGFMPEKLASGEQTVFYWKGNVTPPKSYDLWCDMVKALLNHLIGRYGRDEVTSWPVEIWNEPNLKGFWKDADMREYFNLFKHTFYAVKEVDGAFKVGGPAVCGGTDEIWIKAFLDFCSEEKIPLDFITRHHYTCEIDHDGGHYRYPRLTEPQRGRDNLMTTREIADNFGEFKGIDIHITEFNTSWDPRNVIHDTNKNAAYIAHQLSWLGDENKSYSYWTFGDVFEEQGIPFSEFYGGFGMVAAGRVPKPTFYVFKFYKNLKNIGWRCLLRNDNTVVLNTKDGGFCGIIWNMNIKREGKDRLFEITLPASGAEEYSVVTQTVDEKSCNPLKLWHDIGEPKTPTEEQLELLRRAARPAFASDRLKNDGGIIKTEIPVSEYGVVYFEIHPSAVRSDRGYDYRSVMEE